MKKIIYLLLLFCGVNFSQAHDLNYEKVIPHQWKIEKESKTIDGSFYMLKDGKVFIETTEQKIVSLSLQSLSAADIQFAIEKENKILALNRELLQHQNVVMKSHSVFDYKFFIVAIFFLLFGIFVFSISKNPQYKYAMPVFVVGLCFALFSFTFLCRGSCPHEHQLFRLVRTLTEAKIHSAPKPTLCYSKAKNYGKLTLPLLAQV